MNPTHKRRKTTTTDDSDITNSPFVEWDRIPAEIFQVISRFTPRRDIKYLQLVCKKACVGIRSGMISVHYYSMGLDMPESTAQCITDAELISRCTSVFPSVRSVRLYMRRCYNTIDPRYPTLLRTIFPNATHASLEPDLFRGDKGGAMHHLAATWCFDSDKPFAFVEIECVLSNLFEFFKFVTMSSEMKVDMTGLKKIDITLDDAKFLPTTEELSELSTMMSTTCIGFQEIRLRSTSSKDTDPKYTDEVMSVLLARALPNSTVVHTTYDNLFKHKYLTQLPGNVTRIVTHCYITTCRPPPDDYVQLPWHRFFAVWDLNISTMPSYEILQKLLANVDVDTLGETQTLRLYAKCNWLEIDSTPCAFRTRAFELAVDTLLGRGYNYLADTVFTRSSTSYLSTARFVVDIAYMLTTYPDVTRTGIAMEKLKSFAQYQFEAITKIEALRSPDDYNHPHRFVNAFHWHANCWLDLLLKDDARIRGLDQFVAHIATLVQLALPSEFRARVEAHLNGDNHSMEDCWH